MAHCEYVPQILVEGGDVCWSLPHFVLTSYPPPFMKMCAGSYAFYTSLRPLGLRETLRKLYREEHMRLFGNVVENERNHYESIKKKMSFDGGKLSVLHPHAPDLPMAADHQT